MATTSTPPAVAIPLATPSNDPVVVVAPSSPTPGAKTSEGWLSALSVVLGALPAFLQALGIRINIAPFVQAVGLAISGLTAIHFTAQRTLLKRAHLVAASNNASAANVAIAQASRKRSPQVAAALAGIAGVALVVGLITSSCGGTSPTIGEVGSAAGSATEAGLSCEGVNLEGLVGVGSDANLTVAEAFALALASQNWIDAVGDLVGALGSITVGCAEIAWKDFQNGIAASSGSAIATSATAPNELSSRAAQLEKQYNWKRGPAKPARRAAMHTTSQPAVVAEPVGADGSTYRKLHLRPVGSAGEIDAP